MKKIVTILSLLFILVSLTACVGEVTKIQDDNTKKLDEVLTQNSNGNFDYGKYELIEKDDNKTLNITLEFKTDDIFRVGTVTAIRNLVLENLENKYSENTIRLRIASAKPADLVDYVYKDGAWDKEVE